MKDIINKLLEIDNKAKEIMLDYQDKKNNLDLYISEEIAKRKKDIDSTYSFRINFRKKEYSKRIEEKKKAMKEIKDKGIMELKNKYNIEKDRLSSQIFESIIKGV